MIKVKNILHFTSQGKINLALKIKRMEDITTVNLWSKKWSDMHIKMYCTNVGEAALSYMLPQP